MLMVSMMDLHRKEQALMNPIMVSGSSIAGETLSGKAIPGEITGMEKPMKVQILHRSIHMCGKYV
jgi:hypothetical protein